MRIRCRRGSCRFSSGRLRLQVCTTHRSSWKSHRTYQKTSKVDVHTPKANVQYTTLDRKPLKSVRNRHQTNTILNTSHEPKSTTVLELKYRSYEMFTIIQEFTEKYRGFRGSLFSIHPLSGCERLSTLLTKSMRVHYLSGDDQRAEQIFSQVQTLCMKHDLLGCMVDAHLTASNFEWDRRDKACRVNALMGYMIAVVYSIVSQPMESVANVQLHIIRRLVNHNHKSDLSDYESMLEEARNSFLKTIPE